VVALLHAAHDTGPPHHLCLAVPGLCADVIGFNEIFLPFSDLFLDVWLGSGTDVVPFIPCPCPNLINSSFAIKIGVLLDSLLHLLHTTAISQLSSDIRGRGGAP